MYDLSSKFNTFYKEFVVLPQTKKTELYEKKDLNIDRLASGLEEYNSEHKTTYKIIETSVQGSVAMSTVVQNEDNDYDIDVAVVFDKDELGDKGAKATRNIVADALKRKTKQFNADPEVKTSCVRVKYEDGYHIDFAVYRRSWDDNNNCWKYEHAGSDWQERDLNGLSEWFETQNNAVSGKLRKIVRLSKMFCNSRDSWKNMPSGLLQTVLCNEKLQHSYDRIDELFYYTMYEIVARLESETSVQAPVDNGRDLTPRKSDIKKMINWKNRLKSNLEDLAVLFKYDCSHDEAVQAWSGFFNHEYWNEQISESKNYAITTIRKSDVTSNIETEEFIEEIFNTGMSCSVDIRCTVSGNGFRPMPLQSFLSIQRRYLPHNLELRCSAYTSTVQKPYEVYWKVKNVGPEARRRRMVRGQIRKRGDTITEHTDFYGNHYIECYIIKEGICLARKRIDVPISR